MVSIRHQKHLTNHTIVLILEPHIITSNSVGTKENSNTTIPNPNVYYCKGEHLIKECKKFKQDKAKYKLKTADITQMYKDKTIQKAKKDNLNK